MVMKTRMETGGGIYKRREAIDITCPVCEQNVDTQYRQNYIEDPQTKRLVHTGCVERLYVSLVKKIADGGRQL